MKIKVGKDEVELDENVLKFSPETINDFLTQYASLYRYYQNKYNDAAYIVKKYADQYNSTIHLKFKEFKQNNNYSDKMSEACAKSDTEVGAIQEKLRAAEYIKDELWGFLRSMDYAHDDALQTCYNLRKELDKIYPKSVSRVEQARIGNKLEEIFGKGE